MNNKYDIGQSVLNCRDGGTVRIVDIWTNCYVCEDVTGYRVFLKSNEIQTLDN